MFGKSVSLRCSYGGLRPLASPASDYSLCVCVQVVAVDQVNDGLSATAQLNISVQDYNDNSPRFPVIPDPLRIPEGEYSEESPGLVSTIVPTDADLGANGEVTLSLSSPHPLFRFREVSPAGGTVGTWLCQRPELSRCVAGRDAAGCRLPGSGEQGNLRAGG